MVYDVDYVCNPFVYNICEGGFMKKSQYEMMLKVYEKQRRGDRLHKDEKRWKKKYNQSREESTSDINGVKITRYKPAWQS